MTQAAAMDIFARLRRGQTVPADDPEYPRLLQACLATRALLLRLNQSTDAAQIRALLGCITGTAIDEGCAVFPPFHVNYGRHTALGKIVFINVNCVFLDLGGITIEDDVLIAPGVSLLTESHPIAPAARHALAVAPIHVQRNAWIGANATVMPGVTIGENAVVAAGAVVTRDVQRGTVVGGIPARTLRRVE